MTTPAILREHITQDLKSAIRHVATVKQQFETAVKQQAVLEKALRCHHKFEDSNDDAFGEASTASLHCTKCGYTYVYALAEVGVKK